MKKTIYKNLFLTTLASSSLLLGMVNTNVKASEKNPNLLNKEVSTEKFSTISNNDTYIYIDRDNNILNTQKYHQTIAQSSSKAIVFAPPSNIRTFPNGKIICSVRNKAKINIYGYYDGWFETDYCGWGYIHHSQIRIWRW